jgi:hypothetical protein
MTTQMVETKGARIAEVWRRGQHGWPKRFPVAQFPNPPLLLALAGYGCAATSDGAEGDLGRSVFAIGGTAWAWEEAAHGTNWFRRSLGVGALTWIAARSPDRSGRHGSRRNDNSTKRYEESGG